MRVSDLRGPVLAGVSEFRKAFGTVGADKIREPGQTLYGIVYPGRGDCYDIAPDAVRKFYADIAQAALSNAADP